ncbi:PTS system beta-glucoside-specific IIA component, Glc family /PTS system beta-glucoside-specific IIB component, Glc family /PTS system beta-glucoside-specific IIC component, Glc family [Anaerovirgula multivorans]|uniref:PTS system beta-glucoside-specific IIA component, Glc family /PTS system beta-glucoside-specific IIB component, Glc family /PTS system beta-glucoside-specific IIC component, Glc family n=1 Tax=Anaerovirgula multivorans TaxID=312168 RepID=A0A239DGQ7_9FIRM|nr:beta-glucoside-specific PTS transporter subunit IIABC [Anaerovirgula multivorans]SNS31570.1 PTS system beta-glucoside-specific IIA component, Glc family /PTS system beta-glucoside-specific IIB component, Glc family /PTS system beta-glucoside-specific IIC component, Glc family [Anaerovirgula multivorans]
MNQREISNLIIKHVGGVENISNLYHCMTRLRFNLNDKNKFNSEELKKIPGIINTVQAGDEFQLIIGAEVDKFYNDLLSYGIGKNTGEKKSDMKFNLSNVFKTVLNTIVGIMAPILPIIIAGGMVKVILSLLVLLGMSKDTQNYQILFFISDAPFYFLPFYIANSAAKKFKTNNFMAMVIAGVMLHPNFVKLVTEADKITLFELPVNSVKYGSSVIPIILTVWFMSYVERFVEKFTPKMIKTMLRPVLILIITAPVALIIIGPLGAYFGDGIYFIIKSLNENIPWAVPTLMGAFSPLLVMAGMHLSITPFAVLSVTQFGYETLMGPGMLGSNIAQGGAALAIALKEKKLEKREVAVSAGITALSGITEPALYGVTLKYKRTLACVMVSGGIAGLYAGITGLVRYAVASAGFLSLPVFIGDNPNNIINAVITAIIALVLSFVLTYIFVKVEHDEQPNLQNDNKTNEILKSIAHGTVVPLEEVKDEAFSTGGLGGGVAILPIEGTVYSPIEGQVSMVYPTGHAIGIISKSGREILIHIGIDTVKLDGKGFKTYVEKGTMVYPGDRLVDVDLNFIKENGYDTTIIVLVLNTTNKDIKVTGKDELSVSDELLQITN